ncbi:Component of the 90S pre-ribosome involved in the maturation of rRNAs. Required for early cleavages of the pre-RNAs in the 40S ribosomal subunit maturation pathway (By similarity) [Seminavis robusta]|uniref:rRNA biogenesis protein RRP36 n=1 Tax=Seminavis robusta TaxID=568900 RepID=A0A9N8EAY4_9STRA|nr:Component of the 90S pre-ribosome involved in the maturation of rRNAs. Required for early cleavages of the pre-RNAs in the 40S ribosomal subunit maturation pathway (By similarity) [Seminavis robusta]|eukprot:Sro743_g196070.1 Component of the 90S pre-ribosome involved in the maturation of rRNAs. Required for early cleavages of the pre-RNAs in the 40S ribosomal subunit maturation pathway (By similarity) (314) ;mRNA; f:22583-23524
MDKYSSDDEDSYSSRASDDEPLRGDTELDESESDSGTSDAESKADENKSMSLADRLCQQEERESTMRTTTALKDQRARRIKALPLAKERMQEFRRNQQQKDDSSNNKELPVKKTKKSKHAPAEASSRRRHNKTLNERGIGVNIGAHRYQARDPRMSSLSGHLDQEQFEHHYGFLAKVQNKEIAATKTKLKALKMPGKKGRRTRQKMGIQGETVEGLQEQLQTLQQTVARQNQESLERNAKKAVKKKLQAQVAEGKGGMYFPKRRELKQMEMEAKIADIQKRKGKRGLDNYLAKRRKKQKSRDASRMKNMEPFR